MTNGYVGDDGAGCGNAEGCLLYSNYSVYWLTDYEAEPPDRIATSVAAAACHRRVLQRWTVEGFCCWIGVDQQLTNYVATTIWLELGGLEGSSPGQISFAGWNEGPVTRAGKYRLIFLTIIFKFSLPSSSLSLPCWPEDLPIVSDQNTVRWYIGQHHLVRIRAHELQQWLKNVCCV